MVTQKHKRQKSSILNVYYLEDPPQGRSPQTSPHQEIKSEFSPELLSQPIMNSSPSHLEPEKYDDPNAYYNFPANMSIANLPSSWNPNINDVGDRSFFHPSQTSLPPQYPSNADLLDHNQPHAAGSSFIDSFAYPQIQPVPHSMPISLPPAISHQRSPISKPKSPAKIRRLPFLRHHRKLSSMSAIPQYTPAPPFTQLSTDSRGLESKHRPNLSISSHFNLVHLNDQSQNTDNAKLFSGVSNPDIIALILDLLKVETSSANNFLLKLATTIKQIPLDEFYNLLYNDHLPALQGTNKLDKAVVENNVLFRNLKLVREILEVFKSPGELESLLSGHIIDMVSLAAVKENKLSNINYHELLRTFLAIKILQDMIVPAMNPDEHAATHSIPRLSLYKTYFILCQKLLVKYPSSFQSSNENHKLILGRSKLGKLIKLVFPNVTIKRLGSRGDSKYNYLGVIWNDKIVNDEIKQLCDKFELPDLNQVFEAKDTPNLEHIHPSFSQPFEPQPLSPLETSSEYTKELENYEIFKPVYSYIPLDATFPADFHLVDWIAATKVAINDVDRTIIDLFSSSTPVDIHEKFSHSSDKEYFAILIELTMILLLLNPHDDITTLKQNIIKYINSDHLPNEDMTRFKILLKLLINLNDSLTVILQLVLIDEAIIAKFKSYFNNEAYFANFINCLASYNYDIPVDLDFIHEDLKEIKNFFVVDLIQFLQGVSNAEHSQYMTLSMFFDLLDTLINKFKNYSINISIQFVSLVINDIVKLVYFQSVENRDGDSNFQHWWLINNSIQDYITLVGELVACYGSLTI